MNEQSSVSRRRVMIAASTAPVVGILSPVVANAGQKDEGDRSRMTPPLQLKITLTDGEIVSLKAAEVVIDFGANGQLLVKSNGFLPVRDHGGSQSDNRPEE